MLRVSLFLRNTNYKFKLYPRSISNVSSNRNSDPLQAQRDSLKNYTPIYKFEFVKILSIINRLKLYNTIYVGISIPGSIMLSELEMISPNNIIITTAVGLVSCITFYTLGILANKFIGFIYLNKEENALKIAYVDFWGRRKDIEVPLNDVVPFSEVPASFTDFLYLQFRRFSVEDTLKVNFKYGVILNNDKFKRIFPLPS